MCICNSNIYEYNFIHYERIYYILCDFFLKITIDINRCTLEIKEAFPEDSGTYTVVLQNAAGEIRRSCQVTVESFYSSTT